jgi:DNA-binding LacI/PurR family transcriptional regulator
MVPVPLTSVDLRVAELARRAVAALDDTQADDPDPVQPVLIERASSAPPSPA